MMRSAAQVATLHAQAQRVAFATVTGAAVFAVVLVAAFAAERQQARQDIVMQEMREPVGGGRS
jgi:hypothetical protein